MKKFHLIFAAMAVALFCAAAIAFPPNSSQGFSQRVATPKKVSPDHRLASAQTANPDTVAWITIPGTNIDGPVQQADDNEYYLRRNSLGENEHEGCFYADFECDLSTAEALSTNTIIYGHIVEPFDPDRIIQHEYEIEVEKERPVLDENGVPKLDENGDIIMETYTDTEARVEELESPHMGVDFQVQSGSYVVSSCGGVVTDTYSSEADGNVVEIYHPEAHYSTRYMHLSTILVTEGEEIVMGQPLGKVGTTGECTPYRETEEDVGRVHFEVLNEDNEQIDPAPLLHRWGTYLDIPTMLVQEVAGSEWADWMVSEIADSDIVWNGESYMWPVPGHTALSSDFGYRDLDHDGVLENFHSGIDIPAAAGTPIYAAAPGIVSTKAHWSYGICVKISVDGQTVNVYGHMSARAEGITDGVMVQAGDLIGYVGSTGNSSGNHLHFEVDVSGQATDPKPFFG